MITMLKMLLAIHILCYPGMHSPALEQVVGSHRPKTRHPNRSVRPLALHVLFRVVKNLLGIRIEVRLVVLDFERPELTVSQPRIERRTQRQYWSDQEHYRRTN